MAFTFSPYLLLRRPVNGAEDYTTDVAIIISDSMFRSALSLAAPSLYQQLKRVDFDPGKFSEKERLTLLKYYNRFCFRPTPFGLFSSVALISWSAETSFTGTSSPAFRAIVRADQTFQCVLTQPLSHDHSALFEGNPSIYRALNEFRFIRTSLDGTFRHRDYQLQSIGYSILLKDLLRFCRPGRTYEEITGLLAEAARCNQQEAAGYAEFLVDAQFLLDRARPNITGRDYLYHIQTKSARQARKLLEQRHMVNEKHFLKLRRELKALLPKPRQVPEPDELSIILRRNDDEEKLNIRLQELLREGITALNALTPQETLPAMSGFARSFHQRFEGQCIPLLTALDPEVGIGYQQPDTEKNNPLLETLHIPLVIPEDNSVSWTKAHSLLLQKWHGLSGDRTSAIHLRPEELTKIQSEMEFPLLGMSVLFRQKGEILQIESAGGTNAPSLMGRFTIGSADIAAAAREMAVSQEQLNPDLIFAEVLHLSDPHTDNINRREHIWSFELPVTAASELPRGMQLDLSDLYLTVHAGIVFLLSKKYKKVVIPRLTSAYNHGLNKLPLFRFLADLPYQYGRNNLSFDLRNFFPGLDYYPRVEYCSVILHPATWVLGEGQLSQIPTESDSEKFKWFDQLKQQIKLPDNFYMAEGDQHLYFRTYHPSELLFFLECARQKKEIILKEFAAGDEVRQYNAYLVPNEPLQLPVYQTLCNKSDAAERKAKRTYIPGSEWLYLKIYAPTIASSRLLLLLEPLLRKRYTHGKITRWFFIRYEDHAPHIRLRMQVAPDAISEVLIAFKAKLEDHVHQHLVREYQVDIYNRELGRYMAAGIENTELFFWKSSELVLQFIIHAENSATQYYLFAMQSVMVMLNAFITSREQQLNFTFSSYEGFLPEFEKSKMHVELDKKYREIQGDIQRSMNLETEDLFTGSLKTAGNFRKALNVLRRSMAPEDERSVDYLRSIIHMHLNRVFKEQPRKQEMIIYYLLYKYLRSVIARSLKPRQSS